MGVYIKNMKMPKSCDECRIMVFEDTNCASELFCGCPIVFKAHPQGAGHRPDYCPLVEVPPHGRLIDADALESNGWYLMRVNIKDGKYEVANLMIAPTIIPTEEGE